MPGIVVVVAGEGERLSRNTLEVLGAAGRLQAKLGEGVAAVVVGAAAQAAAPALFAHGVETVYAVSHPLLKEYQAELFLQAVGAAAANAQPRAILLGSDSLGRDLAPRLAHRLRGCMVSECIELDADGASKKLRVLRHTYGGKAIAAMVPRALPAVITVKLRTMEPAAAQAGRTGRIEALEVPLDAAGARTRLVDRHAEASGGVKLEDARVVISGGRGLSRLRKNHV